MSEQLVHRVAEAIRAAYAEAVFASGGGRTSFALTDDDIAGSVEDWYGEARAALDAMSPGQGELIALNECTTALADLLTLKDGPRDEHYQASREAAWERARAAIRAIAETAEGE